MGNCEANLRWRYKRAAKSGIASTCKFLTDDRIKRREVKSFWLAAYS